MRKTRKQENPDGMDAGHLRDKGKRGSALVMVLILVALASIFAVSLLFIVDVDFKTSKCYVDSIEALNDADSAVNEVIWRINLKPGSDAPPSGSTISVNNMENYDASLVYDSLGVLTNGDDDDLDNNPDDFDELNLGWDWQARILLTPDEPSGHGEPYVVTDTDIANGPPYGSRSVEATVQPQATWREYSTTDPSDDEVLLVRFKLDTDTIWGDSEGDGEEIVYYDKELTENWVEDPNTLTCLGGDNNPSNDSGYNITWSDGMNTYQASGTPVLLVEAWARITRDGKTMAKRHVLAEINRPFERVMDKVLCGCDSVTITGGGNIDSFKSSEGDYGLGPIYHNGDVGCNGDMTIAGDTEIKGSVEAGTWQSYQGSSLIVYGNAIAGEDITGSGRDIRGDEIPFAQPVPRPCLCNDPDVTEIVNDAAANPENSNVVPSDLLPNPETGHLQLTGFDKAFFPGGSYYFDQITVAGQATICVGLDTNGDGDVDEPPTEPVRIHVSGDCSLGGGGVVNPYRPIDFQIYSSAIPNDIVDIAGGSEFRGLIYAPLTQVKLTGCSSFMGAALGKTITNPGGAAVHRDEDLENVVLAFRPVKVIAWREVD